MMPRDDRIPPNPDDEDESFPQGPEVQPEVQP